MEEPWKLVYSDGAVVGIPTPKHLADEAGLKDNSPVQLALRDNLLVVVPVRKPALSLDALLAQVTTTNLHSEVQTGPAVGAKQRSGTSLRATTGRCGLADLQSQAGHEQAGRRPAVVCHPTPITPKSGWRCRVQSPVRSRAIRLKSSCRMAFL